MFKVGLTGGIGVGKTTVARIFNILGVPIFNADEVVTRPTMIENPSTGYTKLRWLTKLKAVSKHKATLRKKAEEGNFLQLDCMV